jgi:hypothetical protein
MGRSRHEQGDHDPGSDGRERREAEQERHSGNVSEEGIALAGVTLPDMRPFGRRPLTIPPDSPEAWLRLALWEIWMGMLLCAFVGFAALLIVSSYDRVTTLSDFSACSDTDTLACKRLFYRGGALYASFSGFGGLMLIGMAGWLLWELWSATEPKPITDDFLKLLHDSFARDWRNPLTWPWARVLWAYGFACVGVVLTAGVAVALWTALSSLAAHTAHGTRIDTSQSFRLAP